MKQIKNSQPQTKFTGSYKKKECIQGFWLFKEDIPMELLL